MGVPVPLESADTSMTLSLLQLIKDLQDALDFKNCKEDTEFLRRHGHTPRERTVSLRLDKNLVGFMDQVLLTFQ